MAGTIRRTPAARRKYGQEWGVNVNVDSAHVSPTNTIWTMRRDMSCFGNGPRMTTGSGRFLAGAW